MSDKNPRFVFSSLGGRWMVLLFFGSLSAAPGKSAHDRILARRSLFDDRDAMFFGVSIDKEDREQRGLSNSMPGLRYFWDFDAAVSRGYRVAEANVYAPVAYLLDRSSRIVARAPASRIDELLDLLDRHIQDEKALLEHQFAPVLSVPRVFEPELCAELIRYYGEHGGARSGFMTELNGFTVGQQDEQRKRRSDCTICDQQLRSEARSRIELRLMPMIKRAFGWQASRIERYIVACYSGQDRGFFFPHRDNTSPGTAHRKFAVTINLNADEYEGGDLRFPEFGPRLYKPSTGGAVVFGCGLLHEATPVTAGVRYAFLPFLYDEEGAQVRAANKHLILPAPELAAAG